MQARMLEGCQPKRVGHSRLPRQEGRSRILARSIAACCNEQTAMGTHRKERWRFLPSHKWRRVPTPRFYGGVGAPVGLTVFKTAEGSLGAVPGGFDSHTPLPILFEMCVRICHFTHRFWRFPKPMLPIWPSKTMLPIPVQKECILLLCDFHQRSYKISKGGDSLCSVYFFR